MSAKSQKQKLCYIIMPFSKYADISEEEWTETFEDFFVKAVKSAKMGYHCERSEIRNGAFIKGIIKNLKDADVVLADITGFNGNVMWELGIRHALSPRTILVSREDVKGKKYISDLSSYGVVTYSIKGPKKIKKFNLEIKNILKKIELEPDYPDNPVYDFLKVEDLIMESYEEKQIKNKLTGLMSELIENVRIGETFLEEDKITALPTLRFSTIAVDTFLSENYVTLEDSLQTNCHSIRKWAAASNIGLDLLAFNLTWDEEGRKANYEIVKSNVTTVVEKLNDAIPKISNTISQIKNKELPKIPPKVIETDKKYLTFFEGSL